MKSNVRKLTSIAMLCAISYAVMLVGRIPVVMFLKYDPKDIVIAIGGFIYGPLTALTVSVIVSLIEMITVSDTGFIGLVMNIISTACFACAASIMYKKVHSLKGAVSGLIFGSLLATAAMLLWNYLITPIYMGYPREAVAAMLLPVFLPFNLIKYGLNSALTLLIYKPVVTGLRGAHIIDDGKSHAAKKNNIGLILISFLIIATCILTILAFNKII